MLQHQGKKSTKVPGEVQFRFANITHEEARGDKGSLLAMHGAAKIL